MIELYGPTREDDAVLEVIDLDQLISKDDASRGGTPINDYVTSVQAPRLSGNDFLGP